MPAKRDDPEHRLSHYVDELLERILLPPCWFTAADKAGRAFGATWEEQAQSRMRWEQKQRAYGVKPSQLDWRIVQGNPTVYAEIELKVPGGPGPSNGQHTTIRLLREQGFYADWARTLSGVYQHLEYAGFRLHANAANILAEVSARHSAARDTAAIKREEAKTGKISAKRYAKREASPTAGRLRKVEALRAKGIRI